MYLQINVMEIHSPYLIRPENQDAFEGYGPIREHHHVGQKKLAKRVRSTYSAIRQLSNDTAQFIKDLSTLPGWQNTLFVITSDHGQGLDSHPDVERSILHGNLLYSSQVHVPLILYHPGAESKILAGLRIKQRARLLDLMPTILDYVGFASPADIVGQSLLPFVRGTTPAQTRPSLFFVETHWRDVNKIAAYGPQWKYIKNRDGWKGVNPQELQAVGTREDGTVTDQAARHPEEEAKLQEALAAWEDAFPRIPATSSAEGPSAKEIEQLKALGYLQ